MQEPWQAGPAHPRETLPFVLCNASGTFYVTGFHSTGRPSSCSARLALGQKEPRKELETFPGHTIRQSPLPSVRILTPKVIPGLPGTSSHALLLWGGRHPLTLPLPWPDGPLFLRGNRLLPQQVLMSPSAVCGGAAPHRPPCLPLLWALGCHRKGPGRHRVPAVHFTAQSRQWPPGRLPSPHVGCQQEPLLA